MPDLKIFPAMVLLMALSVPSQSWAQAQADYTSSPPFLSTGLSTDETDADCKGRKLPATTQPPSPFRNLDALLRKLEPSEATNRYKQRLLESLNSLTERSASGTSLAFLPGPLGEGALFQAFFYPLQYEDGRAIKWTGYTQGLFVDAFNNLREDTDGDGRLVLQHDYIIRTRFDAGTRELLVERYQDADGNGAADSDVPFQVLDLRDVQSLWEAGKRLALMDPKQRRLVTWVDLDQDNRVGLSEMMPFDTGNEATLAPYLRAGPEPYTAGNIIKFVRGEQVPKLRDREVTVQEAGGSAMHVWKLGDPMHSSPVVVGPPRERYDVLYGDTTYAEFFRRHRHRRHVVYLGANDGMLHAFNAGYYHRGDDPATPRAIEHGWFTRTPENNNGGPALGQELWGFLPYQLLPHLQWLSRTDYAHVYYVDLKPKVTDARIFLPDDEHPGGWGTILIGGFRMGGSCGACRSTTGGAPMTVRADFGAGMESRTFYTAYFVLDITNPDRDPILLWSFSEPSLGFSTSDPAVVRVGNVPDGTRLYSGGNRSPERWYMVVGSGPTGYDGSSTQSGKLFAIDLRTGPVDAAGQQTVVTFPTPEPKAFMGDVTALDANLDFRVDTVYVGSAIHHGQDPEWSGRLYRLVTRGDPDARTWGITDGAEQAPSVLLGALPPRIMPQIDLLATEVVDPTEVPVTYGFVGDDLQALAAQIQEDEIGPITAAPTVSVDEHGQVWVFIGTGRFYGILDKNNSDPQYLFGLKDPVITGECQEYHAMSCVPRNLINVSDATICWQCPGRAQHVTGVIGASSFEGLISKMKMVEGWYLELSSPRERAVIAPSLVGGMLVLPTYIPTNTSCSSSGYSYALYYETGTAYKAPLFASPSDPSRPASPTTMGLDLQGNVLRKIPLGPAGLVSRPIIHLGHDAPVTTRRSRVEGCRIRTLGFLQSSFGPLSEICAKPALSTSSRYLSWLNVRQ